MTVEVLNGKQVEKKSVEELEKALRESEKNFKSLEKMYEEQVEIAEGLKLKLKDFQTPDELTVREKMQYRAMMAQKKAKVAYEVGRVPKNGRNNFHKYEYVTESDLTDHIRKLMFKNNLAITLSVNEWEKDQNNLKRVYMEITLTDCETGFFEETTWIGEGQDNGDKGFYKAYTGVLKYYLMKTFLVPSGDDPEQDNEIEHKQQKGHKEHKNDNSESRKASENQVNYINKLIKELASFGGEEKAIIETLKIKLKDIGKFNTIEDMNTEMAGQAIMWLKGWIDTKKKNQKAENQKGERVANR